MLLVTEGIASTGGLETNSCCNISGVNLIQLLSLVCMHLQNTSNTLFLTLGRVQNIGTGIHGTGVHTEECQLTYERVSHNLKCQSGERLIIRGVSLDLIAIHINTLDSRDV